MQTKVQSMIEAWASTAFGFVVSMGVWAWVVNPLFNLKTSAREGLGITLIFTVVSIIRGYYTRRLFNWLHLKNKNKKEDQNHVSFTRNHR